LVAAPHRAIATAADVALGVVPAVLKDLQQLGYVDDLKGQRGTRRLFDVPRLLAQWAETYAHLLRPRTLIGRYLTSALLDRLLHHAETVLIEGKSYRMKDQSEP
jgi:hypothetical protein